MTYYHVGYIYGPFVCLFVGRSQHRDEGGRRRVFTTTLMIGLTTFKVITNTATTPQKNVTEYSISYEGMLYIAAIPFTTTCVNGKNTTSRRRRGSSAWGYDQTKNDLHGVTFVRRTFLFFFTPPPFPYFPPRFHSSIVHRKTTPRRVEQIWGKKL